MDESLVIVIAVSIVVGINCLISREFYTIAKEKGFSSARYFWFPFFFGIVGMLMVVALPDRKVTNIPAPRKTANIPAPSQATKKVDDYDYYDYYV